MRCCKQPPQHQASGVGINVVVVNIMVNLCFVGSMEPCSELAACCLQASSALARGNIHVDAHCRMPQVDAVRNRHRLFVLLVTP